MLCESVCASVRWELANALELHSRAFSCSFATVSSSIGLLDLVATDYYAIWAF